MTTPQMKAYTRNPNTTTEAIAAQIEDGKGMFAPANNTGLNFVELTAKYRDDEKTLPRRVGAPTAVDLGMAKEDNPLSQYLAATKCATLSGIGYAAYSYCTMDSGVNKGYAEELHQYFLNLADGMATLAKEADEVNASNADRREAGEALKELAELARTQYQYESKLSEGHLQAMEFRDARAEREEVVAAELAETKQELSALKKLVNKLTGGDS